MYVLIGFLAAAIIDLPLSMVTEILVFVICLLLFRIWAATRRLEGNPPGPSGIPVLGYLPFLGPRPYKKLSSLAKEFGSIYSLVLGNKRAVVLNDPEVIRQAFKMDVFSGRPDFLAFSERADGKNGIIPNEGHSWAEQRKFAHQHLHDIAFTRGNMETIIQEEVAELLLGLSQEIGQPVDIHTRLQMAVMNVLWYLVAGQRFQHDDPKLLSLLQKLNKNSCDNLSYLSTTFMPYLAKVLPGQVGFKEYKDVHKEVDKYLDAEVDYHKTTFDEDYLKDFIDVYLQKISSTKNTNSSFYQDKGVQSLKVVLQDLFSAGSGTTSTTLSWAFLYMMLHPEVQAKCQQEIDQVVGRSRLPDLEDRKNLAYCEAVLCEIQRLASVSPTGVCHSATEDTEFMGYTIPKDTVLIPNLYHVHHDPTIWNEPEEFRPERFLTFDGELRKHDALMPFGAGKRTCMGMALAKSELFLFFTGLLQSMKFSSPPSKEIITTEPVSNIILQPRPYSVLVECR